MDTNLEYKNENSVVLKVPFNKYNIYQNSTQGIILNYKLYFQFLNSSHSIFNGFSILKNSLGSDAIVIPGDTRTTSRITGGAIGTPTAVVTSNFDLSAPFVNKPTYTLISNNSVSQNVYFEIINEGNTVIDELPVNNSYYVGLFMKHDCADPSIDFVPINIIGWDTTANSDLTFLNSVITNANLCFYGVYVSRTWKYYVFEKLRNNTGTDANFVTPMFKVVLAETYKTNTKIKLLINAPVLALNKDYDYFHNQLEVLRVQSRQSRCQSIIYDLKRESVKTTYDSTVSTMSFAYTVNTATTFSTFKYNSFLKLDCIEYTLPRGTANTNTNYIELGRLRNYTLLLTNEILTFSFAAYSPDGGNVQFVLINSTIYTQPITASWANYYFEVNVSSSNFLNNTSYLRIRNQVAAVNNPPQSTSYVANLQIGLKNKRILTNVTVENSKKGISYSEGSMFLPRQPEVLEFSSEEAVFAKNDVRVSGIVTLTELN